MWRDPNPANANGHRRRQLRQKILATQTHCALCGHPVDKTLHHLHPGAPEVDEIIPRKYGGNPLDEQNCQLTHRICNEKKGANHKKPAPPPNTTTNQPKKQKNTTNLPW